MAGLLGFGLVSGVVGAVITRLVHSVASDRNTFTLPRPRASAPPVPVDVQPNNVALPSFITPSGDFYRVDTALSVPQLSHGDWRLRIHGMVEHEATYSFDDLAGFDVVEMVMTLTCVSNPVGGSLISTGVWTGYRVAELLAAAGLEHPQQLRPIHFSQRSSTTDVCSFAQLYPALRPGELIEGTDDPRFRDAWAMARADTFQPAM